MRKKHPFLPLLFSLALRALLNFTIDYASAAFHASVPGFTATPGLSPFLFFATSFRLERMLLLVLLVTLADTTVGELSELS